MKAAEAAAAPMDTSGGSSASDQSTIEAAPGSTAETKEATVVEEPAPVADPMALDNFALSAPVKKQLHAKGIESLFPIQVCCHAY